MTDRKLTDFLAGQVMGWRVAPRRYIKTGRSWIPSWRFSPLDRLEDAFRLLNVAATGYRLEVEEGVFTAEVRIGGRVGKASGESEARTITIGIALALGLALPDESSKLPSAPPRSRDLRLRSKVDGI